MVRLRTSGMLWFFATEPGHRTEARRRWHRIAQSWPRRSGRSCPAVFSHLAVSGQADWTPQRLAWVSTLMAWDEGQTLTVRFEHACQAAGELHPHWRLGTSYAGFTAAVRRWSTTLTEAMKQRFQREMLRIAGPYWQRGRWRALAVDGTRMRPPIPRPMRPIWAVPGRTRRP